MIEIGKIIGFRNLQEKLEHLTHFKFLFQQKLRYFYLTVAAQISSG